VRRRRFAAATAATAACLSLALAAGGCGGHSRHARALPGVTVYTSLPSGGPYAGAAGAIFDGEQLALAQTGGVVKGFKIVLRRLDEGGSAALTSTATAAGASARIAAGDRSTIAYIGDLTPGSSSGSIPVLSQAGILQVSPGDTADGLAGGTFARVVPPDSNEASAQLAEMGKLGVTRLYLIKDRTTYGSDIAATALIDAPSYGIDIVDPAGKYLRADNRALIRAIKKSKAQALLYAGSPSTSLPAFWNALSVSDGTIRKFASAAVAGEPSWSSTSAAARYGSYLSAPGLPRADLPRAGSQFENDFMSTYGTRAQWTTGIFGYVAMSGVLEAMYKLGPMAKDRGKVADAFMRAKNLPSPLGTYSLTAGQTSFDRYFFTTYARDGSVTTPGVD
jgi:branched-chain amino acid transport system substrate-binding protein